MWAKISRYLSGAFVGWCSLLSWVLPPVPTSRYSMYPTIQRVSSIKTLIRPLRRNGKRKFALDKHHELPFPSGKNERQERLWASAPGIN